MANGSVLDEISEASLLGGFVQCFIQSMLATPTLRADKNPIDWSNDKVTQTADQHCVLSHLLALKPLPFTPSEEIDFVQS